MRAWAHRSWPMSVQDGIEVCTGLGSTGDPRDPESFASDMRDRLLGNGALPLSSSAAAHSRSVPLAAPYSAAAHSRSVSLAAPHWGVAHSRSVPLAAPHRGAARSWSVPLAAPHRGRCPQPVRAICRAVQGRCPEERPGAR